MLKVRRVTWALAVLVLPTLCGCATGGAVGVGGNASDALTAADMEDWAGEDLLTVIRRVRPRWLQSRKAVTMQGRQPISVVVDGVTQAGSVDILRNFRTGDVEEVGFVNAADATTQFGLAMMSGAIVVKLKR